MLLLYSIRVYRVEFSICSVPSLLMSHLNECDGRGGRLTTRGPRSDREPKARRPVLGVTEPARDTDSEPARANSGPSRADSDPERGRLSWNPQPRVDSDWERVSCCAGLGQGGGGGPGSRLCVSSSTVVGMGLVSSLTVSGTSWFSAGQASKINLW